MAGGIYLENCRRIAPSPVALDAVASARLWDWTCRELQLDPAWPSGQ